MLSIIKLPNTKLRERSKEVESEFLLSQEVQKLIQEMIPVMYAADGVGLAAPQIGQNIRICIISKAAIPSKHSLPQADLVLVNPVWVKSGLRKIEDWEGCLSVPKKIGKVKRYKHIKVQAFDAKGNLLSFSASDLFARVVQHEADHLDGVLFIDKAKEVQEVE